MLCACPFLSIVALQPQPAQGGLRKGYVSSKARLLLSEKNKKIITQTCYQKPPPASLSVCCCLCWHRRDQLRLLFQFFFTVLQKVSPRLNWRSTCLFRSKIPAPWGLERWLKDVKSFVLATGKQLCSARVLPLGDNFSRLREREWKISGYRVLCLAWWTVSDCHEKLNSAIQMAVYLDVSWPEYEYLEHIAHAAEKLKYGSHCRSDLRSFYFHTFVCCGNYKANIMMQE